MSRAFRVFLILSLIAASAPLGAQEPALPIRRAILYKHGIAYFERYGTIRDDVTLRFKARDMSDILKSLTIIDLSGGPIPTVGYESTKTVEQQLAEYAFDLRAAQGLPAILEQMKGSEVIVTIDGDETAGRILAVEKRIASGGDVQAESYRFSILLEDGAVRSHDLDELGRIRFTEPRIREDLQKYLGILSGRLRRGEKEVTLLAGEGERTLLVSYVQEQPVWKVSYRLVLDPMKKAVLQAWAIVDNVGGDDWNDVSLTLVSGLPVSFIQNLYDPLYVKRPTVDVQREGAVGPIVYEGGGILNDMAAEDAGKEAAGPRREMKSERMRAPEPTLSSAPGAAPIEKHEWMARQTASVAARAAGALFKYDIREPVTIKRNHSALLPIANSTVDARRVSIYDESVRAENPMDGVRIKNTTGLTLEGGAVTVIEENTYAGEALIDTLKADDDRFISFAVDLGTRVNTSLGSDSRQITGIRIYRGTLETFYKQEETKTYTLTNVEPKEKTIVIEHPLRPEWKLVRTPDPVDKTPRRYRFEVDLPARKTVEFTVTEERPTSSTIGVTNLNPEQILFYVRQKYVDDNARKLLENVAALQSEIVSLNAQTAELERRRNEIAAGQERTRKNLSVLGQTEAERNLRNRYVKDFETEENRYQELTKSIGSMKAAIQERRKALDTMLADFSFESAGR